MKKILAAALCAACLAPLPAMAASADGKIEVKVLATGVLPDGKIDTVKTDLIGLPAGSQAKASDTVVPTIAIEYYATPNVSIETICCLTQHHVNGDGALAGANLVNHVLILPATVTLKYHLDAGPVKPYVGVGPALFIVFDPKPGVDAAALGATKVTMPAQLGVALQAGVDIPVSQTGMGISLDAKKYFIKTDAKFYAGSTLALETKHKLDPWVVSGGIYFRF
ncbi:MAG: OmpW family protein [Sphingomonadales bacterium]|nr:OmpW family protein [Sphingomonadales bacterium]MDE2570411.1 OmpW family protein [Sphingomonadales bacterium]